MLASQAIANGQTEFAQVESANGTSNGTSNGLRGLYKATKPSEQVIRSCKASESEYDDNGNRRPDFKFQPTRENFDARVEREAKARGSRPMPSLPEGFPAEIKSDRVWYGKDIKGMESFILKLSEREIEEIRGALRHFMALPGNLGPDQMFRDLFPLPTLGGRLEGISKSLYSERGIVILRGLKPDEFSLHENVLMFAGMTSYIGEKKGCQDRFGNMLTHLVDMSVRFGTGSTPTPTFTGGALPYHNDVCDILAMYVQESAPNGGESTLASAGAVYNEIAKTRPDLIKVLADPIWIYDKDKPPAVWTARPILFPEPAHGPFFCFSRQKITGSDNYPLSPSLPAMTEAQAEAIDMVHYVAEEHGLSMTLDPGDMLLYNNLGILHGRSAFTDVPTDGKRRHILRVWVRNEELAWKTPPGLENDWHLVYGDSERRSRACWKISPEDMERDRVIGHKMTCS